MAEIARERGEETRCEYANTSSAQRKDPQRKMKKKLYTGLMDRKWEEVAGFYQNEPIPTKINAAGDTILHLAILMCDEDGAIKLMEHMEKQDKGRMKEFLQTRNKWGSTPLHQAAFLGLPKVEAWGRKISSLAKVDVEVEVRKRSHLQPRLK
ncbi:putative E3 ubiquitin-protein ligase MIB2 [Cocos nucifera]|uniref:Putative E3 ubiquitin-protein ligase MIB2 n=1 Tax=Cocos nucifera TaxID=13894 RepID=A0A8K0ID67_COCNU|nr:putative E3 ubiquitin-protein ligase MIB2 [Cocos nucifera]